MKSVIYCRAGQKRSLELFESTITLKNSKLLMLKLSRVIRVTELLKMIKS